jgi:hypothetical protein
MAETRGEHWTTLGPQHGEITMNPPDWDGS